MFRLSADFPTAPSPQYATAVLLLRLATAVSGVDDVIGEAEHRQVQAYIESALHLSEGERVRLSAHFRWLLHNQPGFTGLRKRVASLDSEKRLSIGQFLVTLAAADGQISAAEVKALTKIFHLMGLDEATLFNNIHALSRPPGPEIEPVTVRPADAASTGFAIPRPMAADAGFVLDMGRVASKLRETAAVSVLLNEIFVSDEDEGRAPLSRDEARTPEGLDVACLQLLRALMEQNRWSRSDFEKLAHEIGLLPDGALEEINEAAYEVCGEAVCEGEDPIEVNSRVIKELLL